MYFNGQIVWCLRRLIPIKVGDSSGSAFAWDKTEDTTHFIEHAGSFERDFSLFKVALPKSVQHAKELLEARKIVPCPIMLPYDEGHRVYGPDPYVLKACATHLDHLIKELAKLEGK